MPSDLIIFDCDGVLIDSELIACRVSAACLAESGLSITAKETERYIGVSATAMFADLESRSGSQLPVDFPEKVHQRLAKAFEAELTAMPGIETALTALTSTICVASSSTHERVRYALSLVGLLHHFDPHVFSASQVVRGKPAPDLFLFAAGQMGFKPSACLVVEDSVAGVTAATAAGMRVVGFTGGSHCGPGHSACLRQAGAFTTIAALEKLPDLT
jgi:HAD superfamily hydrolase (TIGR01509 family)